MRGISPASIVAPVSARKSEVRALHAHIHLTADVPDTSSTVGGASPIRQAAKRAARVPGVSPAVRKSKLGSTALE
jgi:hypothetical protein